jgi:hypothetical protein
MGEDEVCKAHSGIVELDNLHRIVFKDEACPKCSGKESLRNRYAGTSQTIADASIISNTRHGLFSTDVRSTLDNFTLYARGTGNEYNILNQLMSTTSGGSLNLLGVGK